ncbi:RNA-directed DNA polymerase, eukaryota [Tanacetum coccineum]
MGSFPNSLQSKIDQTSKISKSVFISNFPDDCSSRDLWKVCNGYGTVVDVFIPNKRSKAGKRFAFVRFINVLNLDRLIENLKTIWIGRFHLSANPARFERPKASTFQKEKPVPSGGLWVMIELKSSKSKSKFMEHVGVASWFRRLCNAQSDFTAKERIVWVDIEGVPLNAWTRSTFQKISSKWGELVELEDGEGFLGSCQGTFCLVPILQRCSEKELFSDDESAKINEQANNLNNDEVENASEVVSDTYFGDNGEV